MKHNIGIYCRLSRDDNKERYESIEVQEAICKDFIQKNELGFIINTYIDDNISGTTFDRPALNELENDIHNKKIDLIIAKDLSRFGRNNAKMLTFLDFLEENRIRVIAVNDNFDSRNGEDGFIGIKTWANELYARDISTKIRSSLRQKIKNGEHPGNARFGYKKVENTNNLIIDENVRHIIEEIFDLYISGYGYRSIALLFNEKKYPTPRQYKNYLNSTPDWNPRTIKNIIRSREYVGDSVQNTSEKISFKSNKTRRKPEEEWVIKENTHEGIISREKWELANSINKKRAEKKMGMNKGKIHLFSGFLKCGKCGHSLFAQYRQKFTMTYRCGNYVKYGKKGCSIHHVNENKLKKVILNELKNLLEQSNKDIIIQNILNQEKEKSNIQQQIKQLEKLIKTNTNKLDMIYEDRLSNIISVDLYKSKTEKIQNEIAGLEKQKRKLINELKGFGSMKEKVEKLFEEIKIINSDSLLTRERMEKLIKCIHVFYPQEISEEFKDEIGKTRWEKLYDEGGFLIKFNIG